MTYIGISRGEGTIGIIKEDGTVELHKIPTSFQKKSMVKHLGYRRFIELMRPYAEAPENEVRSKIMAKALIEKPPTNTKLKWSYRWLSSRFFEAECAILEALGISYQIIEPQEWKHDMFTGKFLKLTDKQASLEYGNELYPQLRQNKAKDRDGICMAYYLKNAKQFGKRV